MILKLIDEIEKSLDNGCYMAALSMTLMLPDICARVEKNGRNTTKCDYIKWFDGMVGYSLADAASFGDKESEKASCLTGEFLYQLRCTVLHEGNISVPKNRISDPRNRVDKFILYVRDKNDPLAYSEDCSWKTCEDGSSSERIYESNLRLICKIVVDAAKQYYENNADKFLKLSDISFVDLTDCTEEERIDKILEARDMT